jgi:DNA polymerase III delta prime subunit
MTTHDTPLTELLRPQELSELTLPEREIERLQRMLNAHNPMSMLFYGPPGMGKTSAARIFVKARGDFDTYEVNGSLETGIDTVRSSIERFASTLSFTEGPKLCFIDEAEYLSKNAQASMRGVIERFSNTCRFLLTVNDIGKIMPAIRSRLVCISFAIDAVSGPSIIARMQKRLSTKLEACGVRFDPERLNDIVAMYFPDFRSIVNRLEFEFIV